MSAQFGRIRPCDRYDNKGTVRGESHTRLKARCAQRVAWKVDYPLTSMTTVDSSDHGGRDVNLVVQVSENLRSSVRVNLGYGGARRAQSRAAASRESPQSRTAVARLPAEDGEVGVRLCRCESTQRLGRRLHSRAVHTRHLPSMSAKRADTIRMAQTQAVVTARAQTSK